MSSDFYRELILDYYRNPRNFGKLDPHDIDAKDLNPLCGDEIEMQIRVSPDKDKIEEIKFIGKGCAISQASASMLTELAKGKPLEWVKTLSQGRHPEDARHLRPRAGEDKVRHALGEGAQDRRLRLHGRPVQRTDRLRV